MRRAIGIFLIGAGSTFLFTEAFSQGCSDAGFCTMGAMRPDQSYSKRIALKLRTLELNFYRGQSLLTPTIYVASVDFTIAINSKNFVQIKLPYQSASGRLGTVSGMGDISLSFTRTLKSTGKWSLNGTLGTKIPMGDGNATVNNEFNGNVDTPIHAYYQPSLGSFDAIGGLSWINDKWLVTTGIQVALTQNNSQFLWSDFPKRTFPDREYMKHYDTGRELKRGIDVMFRVERNFRFTNWNFSLGALPIWRITEDNSILPKTDGKRGDREGTTGLAFSLIGSFGYQFDVKSGIKLIHGQTFADREFNPDGLTRKTVNSVSYIYKF